MKRLKFWLELLMSQKRARNLVIRSTVLGLVLAAIPSLAWATPTIHVQPGTQISGPAANVFVTATSDCGLNNVATGGAISITTSADGQMSSNAQRLEGTGPSTDSTHFAANNAANATSTANNAGCANSVLSNNPASLPHITDRNGTRT